MFVVEQKDTLCSELDTEEDEYENYLLMLDEETPIATARWKMLDDKTAKIGRIAVLKEHRGQGQGRAIVAYLTDMLEVKEEIKVIEVSAQDQALPFYKKLGYEVVGEGYMEAGIPHHMVIKEVG